VTILFNPPVPIGQLQQRTFLVAQQSIHLSDMSDHATQPSGEEPRDVHENENQGLNEDFDLMMFYAGNNDECNNDEARDIATQLLTRPNLPLLFRVEAHMVLACGKVDYLYHAREAVHFAELDREELGPGQTSEARDDLEKLLDRARETLRHAEDDSAELKRIKEGLKAGTIKKPQRGVQILYGSLYCKSLHLFRHRWNTNSIEDSGDTESDSSEVEFERRTVGKIQSKVKIDSESDDDEAEENVDGEALQDEIKSDSISADGAEVPQSEVEESTRPKSKGKRKACSVSDDSGMEENAVDGKQHSSSKGRKTYKSAITP